MRGSVMWLIYTVMSMTQWKAGGLSFFTYGRSDFVRYDIRFRRFFRTSFCALGLLN